MKSGHILIDSNILIYAINNSSPKHKKAQEFLQSHIGLMTIAHQNIFESLRVLTHRNFPSPMSSNGAVRAINSIAVHCNVIAADQGAHHIAMALTKKHKLVGDKIFDAYLAATALSEGIKTIATDNTKDFSDFEGITLINPFLINSSAIIY